MFWRMIFTTSPQITSKHPTITVTVVGIKPCLPHHTIDIYHKPNSDMSLISTNFVVINTKKLGQHLTYKPICGTLQVIIFHVFHVVSPCSGQSAGVAAKDQQGHIFLWTINLWYIPLFLGQHSILLFCFQSSLPIPKLRPSLNPLKLMFTQKYVLWKPVYSWIFDIGNKKKVADSLMQLPILPRR